MRPEETPLDLNNFPEDSSRDNGRQLLEDNSSSFSGSYRKKKNGGKYAKDDCEKVYECRFCSLKFCKSQAPCKSQALGGHMNRHRQERETETLNHARQLVYKNDSIIVQAAASPHLGGQAMPPGAFHQNGNLNDPTLLPFRQVYPQQPTRIFPGSTSATMLPSGQHPQHYMYQSPPPSPLVPYTSQYQQPHAMNDYYIGHAVPGTITSPNNMNPYVQGEADANNNSYTCIGAPVSRGPDGIGCGLW